MTVTGGKKKKKRKEATTQKQQAEENVSLEEVFCAASQVVKSDDTTRGWRGDSADGRAAVKGASSKDRVIYWNSLPVCRGSVFSPLPSPSPRKTPTS